MPGTALSSYNGHVNCMQNNLPCRHDDQDDNADDGNMPGCEHVTVKFPDLRRAGPGHRPSRCQARHAPITMEQAYTVAANRRHLIGAINFLPARKFIRCSRKSMNDWMNTLFSGSKGQTCTYKGGDTGVDYLKNVYQSLLMDWRCVLCLKEYCSLLILQLIVS